MSATPDFSNFVLRDTSRPLLTITAEGELRFSPNVTPELAVRTLLQVWNDLRPRFTPNDVTLLRMLASEELDFPEEAQKLSSLADRIAALLPPDAVSGSADRGKV